MATLALFVAAAPFRGFVQTSDGTRMLVRGIDEAPEDTSLTPAVFIDALGAEIGRRAQRAAGANPSGLLWRASAAGVHEARVTDPVTGAEWTGRDLFAVLLRRAIQVAERSSGQAVTGLCLVLPSGLGDADRRTLMAAGHLAGAVTVELMDIGQLVVDAPNSDIGHRHLLIQFDAHQLRLNLFRSGAAGAVLEESKDLSAEWRGEQLIEQVLDRVAPEQADRAAVERMLHQAMPRWDMTEIAFGLAPNGFGPPDPLLLPAEAREGFAGKVIEQVRAILTLRSIEPRMISWIHLQGEWATGMRRQFEGFAPSARIGAATSPAAALELAHPAVPGLLRSRSAIHSDLPTRARVPREGSSRVHLLDAGRPLPVAFADESFPTHYLDRMGLFATDPAVAGGKPVEIAEIQVPRLYERRTHSALQLRLTTDNEDFLVLRVDLGLASQPVLILHDKVAGTSERIADPAAACLLRQERAVRTRLSA